MLEDWLLAQIDRASALPLQQQLYRAMRRAVLDRRLMPGARLPSSRLLASQLQMARNTVLVAYEQLQAEGYLVSRQGAGCYVSEQLPDQQTPRVQPRSRHVQAPDRLPLSTRAAAFLQASSKLPARRSAGAFVPATPDLRRFPLADWQRLVRQHERRAPWQWLDYCQGAGLPELKKAIAQHVQVARAVNCRPEQVIVTASTQQSLDLCFRLLADAGDTLALEDPGYIGVHSAALATDLRCAPVPVDDEGIFVDAIPRAAKMIYVTPSHQYPLGVVMSLARREQLLRTAIANQQFILEDDYDSELRFNGRPLASLQGLDSQQRVFYLGTFSKVFFPAVRLAYVVVPPLWIETFTHAHDRFYTHGNLPLQAALADYIYGGKLASHIRRLRVIYQERNAYLQALLQPLVAQGWTLLGGDAGLHFVLLSPQKIDDVGIALHAAEHAITLRPLSPLYLSDEKRYGFMLGYAAADKRELKRGVAIFLSLLTN